MKGNTEMSTFHAYYYPESRLLTVWPDEPTGRLLSMILPSGELATIATALGDAGFIVVSDWTSKNIAGEFFYIMTATVERVEQEFPYDVALAHEINERWYDEMEHAEFAGIGIFESLLRD
jgi:hypothetical protein